MRSFFIIILILAWLSPLPAEDLAVPGEGPKWRMASVGRVWAYELPVKGGLAPCTWTLTEGALPPGIHLLDLSTVQWGSPSRMGLYGVASEAGQWPVKLGVTDTEGRTAEAAWTVEVSPLALDKSSPALEVDSAVEWQIGTVGAAGGVRFELAPEAYLPLGLTLSGEGVLRGRVVLPGRYEVPVELRDEAGQSLRTVVSIAVYGRESALPQLSARVGVEGPEVTVSLENLPETAVVDIDWGDGNGDPLKARNLKHTYTGEGTFEIVIAASLRDGVERVEARYTVSAHPPVADVNEARASVEPARER